MGLRHVGVQVAVVWNEICRKQFYKSLGSVPLDEWTMVRVTDGALDVQAAFDGI
jgi:hypothetical protein